MKQPVWFFSLLEQLTPDQLEEFEERAGIIEYDAGFGKEHAECLALLLIIRDHQIKLR